mmetsp:Transcript_30109/g.75616  ORF Transcript_30109/g.75616 Transcript_30109/m.75616 type:complete len:228 (-) Transcript_30109:30-713(-)
MGLDQDDTFHVRVGTNFDVPSHLPHDVAVFGLAIAGTVSFQHNLRVRSHDKVAGHLEDEDVGGGAVYVDLRVEVDARAPRVDSRREGLPGDAAGPDVEVGAAAHRAPSRVSVGQHEIPDSGRQLHRRGLDVGGPEGLARHLRRHGELACRGVLDQGKAGHGRGGNWADANVAVDAGRGDGGDAGLRQDGEVGRGAEEHGVGGREERECRECQHLVVGGEGRARRKTC